jgi:hypothetical protein
LDDTGSYARCTREERAGGLPQNADGTYSHGLIGTCRCGHVHGDAVSDKTRRAVMPNSHRRRSQQRFRSYFTLRALLRKRYGEGASVTPWVYHDAAGREAFRILRIDYRAPDGSKGKSYRPCHEDADGRWRLARPEGPLPLYRLPAILAIATQVTIILLEGEKCADIATSIGMPHATTSAHGAQAPQLTDWSPLAGRSVAILGDADADGMGYVTKVTAILTALYPPAEVRIVGLPGLSDGDDIEQWIAAERAAGLSDGQILERLHVLIDSAIR